jgi:hypothetical protein
MLLVKSDFLFQHFVVNSAYAAGTILYTVKPALTATSIQQPPVLNSQFDYVIN